MTITEAVKLALEALEELTVTERTSVDIERGEKAITALREALTSVPDWASEAIEQPAQQKPLTDEQIVAKALHLSGLGTSPDVIQFARAIEASHGIAKEKT